LRRSHDSQQNSWALPGIFAAIALLLAHPVAAAGRTPMPKVIAYVPNWGELAAFSDIIDYAKITHINLAFENPVNAQGDLSFDGKDAVRMLS